ncbi:DUF5694 domain-containing protein [Clostridium tunisiense]|nr:DUF5694 domain-containing protein [Clostridium tunisiense]
MGKRKPQVMILGSSHVWILSNFIRESQLFELVDVLEYL